MFVPNLGPRVGSQIRLPFLNPLAPLPPFGPFGLFGPFEPLGPFGPFWPFGPLWDPWNPFWTLGALWGPLAILGTISDTTIECSPNLRLKALELCDLPLHWLHSILLLSCLLLSNLNLLLVAHHRSIASAATTWPSLLSILESVAMRSLVVRPQTALQIRCILCWWSDNPASCNMRERNARIISMNDVGSDPQSSLQHMYIATLA